MIEMPMRCRGSCVVDVVLWSIVCTAAVCSSFESDLVKGRVTANDGPLGEAVPEFLPLVDAARRSLGEVSGVADSLYQTLPMLYSGTEDGLLEGPTWGAYWTQNSYGTAMTTLPFLGDVVFHGMQQSQNWWFNNMADGTNAYGSSASQGWAPDGCLCDNGEPAGCNYKQGDGNVPIHDWTLEETLSGLVMQAEMLVISRNASAIKHFLPLFLRTSNLIETRRDPATQMTMFLSGPSSNLLAPSFGGWTLENGQHAWSYLTGISVTYSAALLRMIECAKLVKDTSLDALFSQRLTLNAKGLDRYLAPGGEYFVRSVDPNGTLHGVLGQSRHGYFESSPNHDAVALGVVNASMSQRIVAKIKSLEDVIRPNVFILPNSDALGKPSRSGAGGIGYDDMACGTGATCGGIFEFGTWVNGGVWTTTEGRWLLAAAKTGDMAPAIESFRQMLRMYAATWRMDNPLVDFGLAPYQPNEPVNLVVDNFASAGGLLRGLFEYNYNSTSLSLVPHLPDNVTEYSQAFGVRWGPYSILLSTSGVRSSGIYAARLNGEELSHPHMVTPTSVTLHFDAMPTASAAAIASQTSSVSTAKTNISLEILFKTRESQKDRLAKLNEASVGATSSAKDATRRSHDKPSNVHNCSNLSSVHGISNVMVRKLIHFVNLTSESYELDDTLAHSMAALSLAYLNGFEARCTGLNEGSLPALRSFAAEEASLVQMLSTAVSISAGLENQMSNVLSRSAEPVAKQLIQLWRDPNDARRDIGDAKLYV